MEYRILYIYIILCYIYIICIDPKYGKQIMEYPQLFSTAVSQSDSAGPCVLRLAESMIFRIALTGQFPNKKSTWRLGTGNLVGQPVLFLTWFINVHKLHKAGWE